ncbi:MAG: DEAD/DEAH box helicase [Gammaproteobacteria bacterium]
MDPNPITSFKQLALKDSLLKSLNEIGYETPSPIQSQTIPLLLEGKDLVGQAQTGTGKTAAFALPILSNLDLKQKDPQVLVLAPTRELAIQVAEAFKKYASHLKTFHVLPIYGGQDYRGQIRALQRGVHVAVGTPGRVMDHMRRGTLKLDNLKTLVLDEADEMLRMGFIDDVEWVLEQIPEKRQIALFSATMPQQIRRIANNYLNDPVEITVKVKTTTAETIRQRFWPVSGMHNKLDALTRILEAESFDAMLIFVRTKTATTELADKLAARGYSTSALNGDIAQNTRERTIQQLKNGKIDLLVATDVAARGLDVQRISHVINFDIPYDTEAYVHRIGRTGRAGREGDAILFVAPREKHLLNAIEKATKKKIDMMELPSTELINDKRIANFKQRITDTLANEDLGLFTQLIEQYQTEHNVPANDIAAALAQLSQGDTPLLLKKKPQPIPQKDWDRNDSRGNERKRRNKDSKREKNNKRDRSSRGNKKDTELKDGMERFRLEVGHNDQVKPGNIVGAIANEAGLESQHIGRINIHDDYSIVDLPSGMPKDIFNTLKKTWVAGKQLKISLVDSDFDPGRKSNKNKKTKLKSKSRNKSRSKTSNTTKNKDHKKRKKSRSD